tara:strand:- start:13310 stop:14065 length:756 start_codon:yes stop_codon:yes gene_type:complete
LNPSKAFYVLVVLRLLIHGKCMSRKLIIGDIHGCLTTFEALLDTMNFSKSDKLYLVGDYIDRGPDSKGVIDKIMELKDENYNVVAIRGNHEQMLIDDYEAETLKGWYSNADEQLLNSFGIRNLREFPDEYLQFCKKLPLYYMEDEFILVHAGINFNRENPLENKKDLLWVRNWYHSIDKDWLGDRIIIHGHTMIPKSDIEEQFANLEVNQYLDIDCGAVVSRDPLLGYLCCFDLTNEKLHFQENMEVNNKF